MPDISEAEMVAAAKAMHKHIADNMRADGYASDLAVDWADLAPHFKREILRSAYVALKAAKEARASA